MSEASTRVDELLSHAGWLRELAHRLVGEVDADDAIQEVWLTATRRPAVEIDSERGWLRSALRSVHLRKVERQRAAAARERLVGTQGPRADALREGLPSAEEMAERAEAQRLLVEAVLQLREPDRQTVLLHFFEGLSAAEIARRSGVPSSTIRTRVARGVRSLRDRLDESAGGDTASGRAAWLPALSLLAPPSGAVITPTLVPVGLLIMWKLGALLAGLALVLWTGFQFLDQEGAGSAARLDPAAPVDLAAASPLDATPPEGVTAPLAGEGERAPAGKEPGMTAAAPGTAAAPAAGADSSPGVVLTGRVLDPSGQPVEGAIVCEGMHFEVTSALRAKDKILRPNAKTGKEGRFRLELDSTGGAVLCARAEGFAGSEEYAWDPAVTPAAAEITMRLRLGATVTGIVYSEDQEPIAGRDVRLASTELGEFLYATTDEAGGYRFEIVTPGPWRAATFPSDQELRDAGQSTAPANAVALLRQAEFTLEEGETADVPLGLVSPDSPRISGTLLYDGQPVGGLMQWFPAERPMDKKVCHADDEGHFKVGLPSPGKWVVHANAPEASSRGQRRTFTFKAGEQRKIELNLRGGRLVGQVVDANGKPLKGVMLELRAVGGAPHQPAPTQGGGLDRSDREGRYEFGLLVPGKYIVVAHGSRPTTIRTKRGAARSEVVEVTGANEFVASPLVLSEGESFAISVAQKNGRPVSRASLYFHDAEGYCLNPLTKTGTAGAGKATSPSFEPGTVWVTATHLSGTSRPVAVQVGSTTAVNLVIEGEHWIEVDGGTEWLDETNGHLAVIDAGGRRWNGLVDMTRLFETRPQKEVPLGALVGPFPHGNYTVTHEGPGGVTRRGSVVLTAESPLISTVPLR